MTASTLLIDLLVTVVVFVAVMGLFTDYAEAVMAATLLAVIWQAVDVLGASLFLATVLVTLAGAVRAVTILVDVQIETPLLAQVLDDLLSPGGERGRDPEEHRRTRQQQARVDTDVGSIDDYRR